MCIMQHRAVEACVGVKTAPYAFLRDESLTEPFWGKKANSVYFLLGNSYTGELPRRKHTTFRTRGKFEIKKASSVLRCATVHLHLTTAFNGAWC